MFNPTNDAFENDRDDLIGVRRREGRLSMTNAGERNRAVDDDERERCEVCGGAIENNDPVRRCGRTVWHAACDAECPDCHGGT